MAFKLEQHEAYSQQMYGQDPKRSPPRRPGVGPGTSVSGKVPDGPELWSGENCLQDFMLSEEHRGACNGQSRFLGNGGNNI